MDAKIAALMIKGYCKQAFPDKSDKMESMVGSSPFMDVFNILDSGSHKYIPTEKLNQDLDLPQGEGIYGYVKMQDNSFLLLTCDGPLAIWTGSNADKAEFPKF